MLDLQVCNLLPHVLVSYIDRSSRARRIKCDEEKPACQRCVRTGRKCEGYTLLPPRTWHEHMQVREKAAESGLQPWYGGLLHLFGDEPENRAFQHYVMRTAPTMSSYCGARFWAGIVPQAGQLQPAVKHTMLALSALHESCNAVDRATQLQLYSAHQSRAVSLLARSTQPPPVETVLIACLLFASCDFVSAQPLRAMTHLHGGLSILHDLKESKGADAASMRLISDSLWPIYASFAAKSSVYGAGSSDPSLDMHVMLDRPVVPAILPDFFLSQHSLAGVIYWLRFFVDKWRRSPSDYDRTAEVEDILNLLREWDRTFSYYESKDLQGKEPQAQNGALYLRIHHCLAMAVLHDYPIGNLESLDEFEYMVLNTEALIHLGASDNTLRPGQIFPNEMIVNSGCIPQLYFTATRCTDPFLRRQALHLLASLNRVEGLWNSCFAAKVAEQVIILDEDGDQVDSDTDSGVYEPLSGRVLIHAIDTDQYGAGQAMLTYRRTPSPDLLMKLIEWTPCDGHIDPAESIPRTREDEREALNKLMRVSGCGQGLVVPKPYYCSCHITLT